MERETIKQIVTMKEYPYISIIFLEFWREQKYIEDDILIITSVTECDSVYDVRFIKESWSYEAMLDLPISYYKRRLRHYKSIEREIKLKELGI